MLTVTNNVNQTFAITGANAVKAYEDALSHINSGRPFGRRNLKRIELMYGVKVRHVPLPMYEKYEGSYEQWCDNLGF